MGLAQILFSLTNSRQKRNAWFRKVHCRTCSPHTVSPYAWKLEWTLAVRLGNEKLNVEFTVCLFHAAPALLGVDFCGQHVGRFAQSLSWLNRITAQWNLFNATGVNEQHHKLHFRLDWSNPTKELGNHRWFEGHVQSWSYQSHRCG